MNKCVEKAFVSFDNGIRPGGYKPPKYWYVLNPKGQAYPAKAIWALVINGRPGNFNTLDARNGLAKLDYSLIDTRSVSAVNSFDADIDKSLKDSSKKRRERLSKAQKKPKISYALVPFYNRNPDVAAEILERAQGVCERCKSNAPFKKKSNGKPYLEVHHKTQLSHGGNDTVENAIALCPNCHREYHFG